MTTVTPMILLVDDDEFHLEMIHAQLVGLGYEHVICAASGAAALAHLQAHGQNIVAIICDLSMPDMDGLALIRHLAQLGSTAGIILLSGAQGAILQSAARLVSAHGMHLLGVLAKPCSTEQLQQLLTGLQPPRVHMDRDDVPELTPERLAKALASGEFIPWYQPKVDARSARVVGVEALARWPAVAGGMIGPARFVPAMEAAGLADELFFSMAQQTARDLADWHRQHLLIKVALNLSMDTALNLSVPERLQSIVSAAGLQPSDFIIEVTESQLMVDRALTMESLTRLSLMGFALSIDDFGTGYSSLVQLIDLPFMELKIDGSFVRRAIDEQKARSVLRMAILLGNNLGMQVVAEGVETLEQLEFVRSSGGHMVQGYYFARPMPLLACTDFLRHPPSLSDELQPVPIA
jgi:EAL domain-containing protein (putative c-di-GMP-specific phosphodiesterase class I)/DNA-binding NarL/FixJ family response regulator